MAQSAPDFWSRRRAAVASEEAAREAEARAIEEARIAAELEAARAEMPEEAILAELGLPDPDTLKPGDDFSAFLAKAVPEAIRRRALRKLWTSNPVLANLDGLVDHGEDFTDSATVQAGMKTAYEVGRGLKEHVRTLRKAAEELEARTEVLAEAEPPVETTVRLSAEPTGLRAPDPTEALSEDIVPPAETTEEQHAPTPRRHMRFAFETPEESQPA